jgi:hypothetical protein
MERHEKQWPMPARYLSNKEGIIRAAEANADYTVLPEPSERSGYCGR